MANKTVNVKFILGMNGNKQAEKSLRAVNREVDQLRDVARGPLQKALTGIGRTLDSIGEKRNVWKSQRDEIKKTSNALEILENQNKRARDRVGAFGDADTALSTIGSVVGGGAGQALTGVADFAALTEGLGQLQGVASGAASALGQSVFGLTGMAAALPAIGIAAAAAGAAFLVLGPAIQASAENSERLRKAAEREVAIQQQRLSLLDSDITEEQARKEIESLEKRRNALDEFVAANTTAIDAQFNSGDDRLSWLGVFADGVKRLEFSVEQGRGTLESYTSANEKYNAEITDIDARLTVLREGLKQGAFTTEELKEAESKLNGQREQAAKVIEQLDQQEQRLIQSMEQRRQRADEDLARANARAARDRAVQEERDAQRLNDALEQQQQQHAQQLQDIAQNGFDQIEAARQALADKESDAVKKRQELERQFIADAIKRTQDYITRESRIEEDAARERVRRLRDLQADLQQAFIDNDLSAALRAQRAGERDLSDMAEDQDVDARRRAEDFARQNEEARQAFDLRMQQIDEELVAFKEQTARKIEEIRVATDNDIAEAQRAFAEKQALDQAAREQQAAWEAEDRARREADAAEDRAIRRAREDEDLQAQLDAIQTKRDAEEEAMDAVLTKVEAIKQTAESITMPTGGTGGNSILDMQRQLVNQAAGGQSSLFNDVSPGSATYQSLINSGVTPFAKGGIVRRPTLGLVGEAGPEAIVPLGKRGAMGGINLTVPITVTGNAIGETVSKGEVMNIARQLGDEFVVVASTAIKNATMGA